MRLEYQSHPLNDFATANLLHLAGQFSQLMDEVEAILPKGRELALVATKLQEAFMFARMGIEGQGTNWR